MFFVYIYLDPERNVPMYVGKGKGKRHTVHLRSATNLRFRNRLKALSNLKLDPTIEVFPMPSEDASHMAEVALIAMYGRKDLGRGPLYNATDGGEGSSGRIVGEETRKKISQSNSNPSAETRAKIGAWERTPEICSKIGVKQKEHLANMTAEELLHWKFVRTKDGLRPETRAQMSQSALNRTPLQCPHCDKTGNAPGMYRHHFDRCRAAINRVAQ